MIKRTSALLLVALALTAFFTFWLTTFQPVKAQPATSVPIPAYTYYDLNYVASNLTRLNGTTIATRGLAKFLGSIYMYEDFWLQDQVNQSAKIPVVVRFANLSVPREDALIEIQGTIEYINLAGGLFYLNASSLEEVKNVILIGWDGVQRNHLFELLKKGLLPNLQSFIDDGTITNVTVSDHRTDTKSGWTQILTGYRWWKTGVYNNAYWFHSIPLGYTIPERVENYFGKDKVVTAHITGKMGHMEVLNGSGTTATGLYTHEAIYSNIPSQVDVCEVGNRDATVVGPLTLQFLENHSKSHFSAFFHFSDPDSAGHNTASGGENSALYENAIIRCDNWTGQILNKLNALNITQNTLVYVTADHGFDENGKSHNNAPFIFLATNDKRVNRNGDQVDVAPTVYYGLGMWGETFDPSLDGYPLQTSLPDGVEERRQNILADNTQPQKPTITSPAAGAHILGTVIVKFNASDKYLNTVLLLINNTLKADGPWTWQQNDMVKVNGSYSWDTTNLPAGNYTITILAFDEHGATNSPSTSTVTVTFTQILTVNTIGNGAITLNKAGPYHHGDVIQLTAVPNVGWSFTSWSNALTGSINPTTITMDSDKTVTATFTQNQYILTVNTIGNGAITLNKAGPYHHGDVIQLTAVPNVGWSFTSWSNALTGANNPATIIIDGNKAVTATFTETVTPTPLTVTVTPTSINLTQGQAATFSASVSGGDAPYTYQWYLNGTAVTGATYSTYAFTPETGEEYSVYVEVTDAQDTQAQSDAVTDITVNDAGPEDNVESSPTLLVVILVALVIVAGILIKFKKRKKAGEDMSSSLNVEN